MRKILISPGYGSGWSTWMEPKHMAFTSQYRPLVDALEARPDDKSLKITDPVVIQFVADYKAIEGVEPYLGGLNDLTVIEVPDDDPYRIEEYDGSEYVVLKSQLDWF